MDIERQSILANLIEALWRKRQEAVYYEIDLNEVVTGPFITSPQARYLASFIDDLFNPAIPSPNLWDGKNNHETVEVVEPGVIRVTFLTRANTKRSYIYRQGWPDIEALCKSENPDDRSEAVNRLKKLEVSKAIQVGEEKF
jgi:hypothetical protein